MINYVNRNEGWYLSNNQDDYEAVMEEALALNIDYKIVLDEG